MTRSIGGTLTMEALAKLHAPTDSRRNEVLKLIERARYDLQRGWNAAALDALKRAVKQLESLSTNEDQT